MTDHLVARFLQVPVMLLDYVPYYRREQARIILQAKHGARLQGLGKNKLMPVFPVDIYEM